MLSSLILAASLCQAPTTQPVSHTAAQPAVAGRWYPMLDYPGWEGYGVPNGWELSPVKWRQTSNPTVEQTQKPAQAPVAVARPYVGSAQPTVAAAQPAASYGDPYGFLNWLNGTRARYGLGAVGYDQNLANWASQNNAQQQRRGIGHYIMGPARRQNAAMGGYGSIGSMWMNSPGHRAALLDPTIRMIGLAGAGAYWTFNAY